MPDLRPVFFVVGLMIAALGFAMFAPMIVDLAYNDRSWRAFGISGILTDALFEATSGITTTGSTVLTGLDDMPKGILLWRAILQWIGGVGIIVTAMAVLPMLKVGGMQLFRLESSDMGEKVLPRAASLAAGIGGIYVVLTLACMFGYIATGMNGFAEIGKRRSAIVRYAPFLWSWSR